MDATEPQEVEGRKTPKKGMVKDNGPSIDVSLPPDWFDDCGPMVIADEEEIQDEGQQQGGTTRSRSRTPTTPRSNTNANKIRPKTATSSSSKEHDVVMLSDDEEESEKSSEKANSIEIEEKDEEENVNETNKNAKANGHLDSFFTSEQNDGNNQIDETSAKPSEIRQIVLTRAQLHQLRKCSDEMFKKAVLGCFVRVVVSPISEKFKDLIFIDQIVEVLEPRSYQHFWFNRRLRLQNFGDYQIDQIHELAIQKDADLAAWFCCMEAKGLPIPSHKFVQQKKADLSAALKEIDETKTKSTAQTKTQITRADLGKIVLNQDTLSALSKLEFDKFKKAVIDSFVCIQAVRSGIPDDCQYHILRVADCLQRQEDYKVRNISVVNYQLVLPFYGNYIIPWLRTYYKIVTDSGFKRCIDDMKAWGQSIPTTTEINEKAAELQMALNEAESIPSFAEKKRKQKETEEKEKRANLPIKNAQDLNKNLLKQQNLQKLAVLAQKDFDQFERTMVGSFVRLKVKSSAKQFQVDQIRALELVELKPPRQEEGDDILFDDKWEPTFEEQVSIQMKYAGCTSLRDLIVNSSAFHISQMEFDEWLQKMHNDPLCRPIPTYALIEKKEEENNRTLELAEKLAIEQKKSAESTSTQTKAKEDAPRNVEEVRRSDESRAAERQFKIPKKSNYQQQEEGGGGRPQRQYSQWRPRREIIDTPGLRSGWMNSSSSSSPSSTIAPLRQQWRQQTQQQQSSQRAGQRQWSAQPQPLAQRIISDPNQINFVPERSPWMTTAQQHNQIQKLLSTRLSRYDELSTQSSGTSAIPGQPPATFFGARTTGIGTTNSNISSTNNQQMERSLGFFHDSMGRITSAPFADSDDAMRRAIPNERLPQLINQREMAYASSSSSTGYGAHYNSAVRSSAYSQSAAANFTFASSAPKRARQMSPQPPPVHRIF